MGWAGCCCCCCHCYYYGGEAASAPAVQDVQDDGVWEDYEGGRGGVCSGM